MTPQNDWPADAEPADAEPAEATPAEATQAWPDGTAGPAAAPSRRRPLLAIVLTLLPLLGIVVFLLVAFQPFADAAGGCGGG
jgi:hypothetical protein